MTRGVAFISLILSLEAAALLLILGAGAGAGASAAAVPDGMDAIRLPTDNVRGVADDLVAAKGAGGEERPWECCDLALCTRSQPLICRCLDKVDRCSVACKRCEETEDSRRTCADWYKGQPGPWCHKSSRRGGTPPQADTRSI